MTRRTRKGSLIIEHEWAKARDEAMVRAFVRVLGEIAKSRCESFGVEHPDRPMIPALVPEWDGVFADEGDE
jgi:hypothetical protein